ncbi:MAG TPA: hypothetical protein PK821_05765, partial [Victivallales bacterium]|nr:hypothetical protein [Victivallales bacterium]
MTVRKKDIKKERLLYKNGRFEFRENGIFQKNAYSISEDGRTMKSNCFDKIWSPENKLDGYPDVSTGIPIVDAVYKLALDVCIKDISEDGSGFKAGSHYKVWVRDGSYSIMLGCGYLFPEISRITMLSCIQKKYNKIMLEQYPAMSDCVIWIVAAYEYYKMTGDISLLAENYQQMVNTLEFLKKTRFNKKYQMFIGGGTFMDHWGGYWSEKCYEQHVYCELLSFSNNVIFFKAYRDIAEIAKLLRKPDAEIKGFEKASNAMRKSINRYFRVKKTGSYGEYYDLEHFGKFMGDSSFDSRKEALGLAFAVLWNLPEKQADSSRILDSMHITDIGVSTIWPWQENDYEYHNKSVWGFIQGFWNWALAEEGKPEKLMEGLACMVRMGAMDFDFREMLIASTGFGMKAKNQLWNAAGYLSTIFRSIAGIRFEEDGMRFKPLIPA